MKNVTITVEDEVYRRARVIAAERDTSVSALVAGFLRSLGGQEARFQRLLRQERQLRRSLPAFNADDLLSRDDLHRRS